MKTVDCLDEHLSAVGEYDILALIAEGSMARVYKAKSRKTGSPVAIKVPLPHVVGNKVLRDRFRLEYQAGSNLNHPNIVRTLEFGQDDSLFYLVMEYVDGPDLWEHIRKQRGLPEKEAVRVIVQAAQGLHEAHQQGIIHRDVKPENILLTSDGQAKLGDLGLIKELEGEMELTCPDQGLGTPNFMAPEQFTEARSAGVRCDVYSLGATLYMAVTGVLPFQAKTVAATLRKKLNNELTPPRELVPSLSKTVDWTIRRAVQVDPQRRHASCLEFIQSLTGEGNGSAVPSGWEPEGSTSNRGQRPAKERRRATRYPCTLATLCELATSIHPEEDSLLDRWPGKVLNLSATGIGLLLDRRIEPGTVVGVVLESPDGSFQYRTELKMVRSIPSEGKKWFIGGAFVTPLEKGDLRKLLWNASQKR
jgi:serine/threonine protein kinase